MLRGPLVEVTIVDLTDSLLDRELREYTGAGEVIWFDPDQPGVWPTVADAEGVLERWIAEEEQTDRLSGYETAADGLALQPPAAGRGRGRTRAKAAARPTVAQLAATLEGVVPALERITVRLDALEQRAPAITESAAGRGAPQPRGR